MKIPKPSNFIEEIVVQDIKSGKHAGRVHTRFPPEPNGYLHIGHVKSIVLNFGLAAKYGGITNLRFDDTNPSKEEQEYVDAIRKDVKWLGFDWGNREYYASDYFEDLYQMAIKLIKKGVAYIDDSTAEEIATYKGTPTTKATPTPYRSRSIEENLDLFHRMRHGEFEDGAKVLRAKISLDSPNMHLRDPLLYRIKRAHHHRTGDDWCIYPMYDFAHGQSDSLEEITHSLCTLEFLPHRPLYNWCIKQLQIFPSRQIEFARLNLTYTLMSKRKLLKLVQDGIVNGWDDPRMLTVSGLRRRGYTPSALREFADRIGIAKRDNMIDMALLEFVIREELNRIAMRVMVVTDPIKVTITNYDEGKEELLTIINNPEDESAGARKVPFSNSLFIEREDFMENPPKKWFRLSPGGVARLKGAYIIQCDEVVKDDTGQVAELKCTYFPESKSGQDNSGIKVKGVLHWVSAPHAYEGEVRLYDRLFNVEDVSASDLPMEEIINPDSLIIIPKAKMEPSLKDASPDTYYQFMRKGYFCLDSDTTGEQKVFNRTVTLKDGWKRKK